MLARSSIKAPRTTTRAERTKSVESAKPTKISGQADWVNHTPAATNKIEIFATMSLREHSQTELILMSSVLCRHSNENHRLLAINTSKPIRPITSKTGTCG